jgi:3-oxoacyl-(acyl-carrier-protein) synthase
MLPVFEVPADWTAPYTDTTHTQSIALLICACDQALRQARINTAEGSGQRIGVVIGTSVGASLDFLEYYRAHKAGSIPDLAPIRSYMRSNPAEFLSRHLDLTGPALTVTNACSSGADALGIACSWIRQGFCDIVLAGGTDALSEISYNGFARLMISSPEPCRPFDCDRKGLNLGEGAAVMVLEGGRKRGAAIKGSILGYGTCCDAHHLTAPHPEAMGLKQAVHDCLHRSGLTPKDIGFINVHGTATANNDVVEGLLLREMFPNTPFSATKGFTGHTLGAAGAIEAAFTLACLSLDELPPSKGFSKVDPAIGLAPVATRTAIQARYALSLSLAFGGINSALVLERGDVPCV